MSFSIFSVLKEIIYNLYPNARKSIKSFIKKKTIPRGKHTYGSEALLIGPPSVVSNLSKGVNVGDGAVLSQESFN